MPLLGPSLRRGKLTPRSRLRAVVALLASLLLNAVALRLLSASGAFRLPHRPARAPVALAPLGRAEWDANRQVRPPRREPPAPRGEVVELSPEQRASDEAPDGARYLSDRNSRVERETASRHGGHFPRLAPRPEPGSPGGRSGAGARGDGAAAAAERKRGRAVPTESRSRRREDALAMLRPDRAGEPVPSAEAPRSAARPEAGTLAMSAEELARIAGGPNLDGRRDAEEGEETWLDSREFRFATYLNQMRREIGEEWYPRVREAVQARDPGGESFFYRERTVVLSISLAPSGELEDLSVLQSSAIPFVDEIAIASVRRAQPFPNPPRAMFEDGAPVRVPFAFTIYPAEGRGALRWRTPTR